MPVPVPVPRSQRISSSPLSTPLADTSAGLPKTAPSAAEPASLLIRLLLLLLLVGGRWTRRNGRGDACAAKRQLRVKADWETRIATTGGCSIAVGVGVVTVAVVVRFVSVAGNVGTDAAGAVRGRGSGSLVESRSRGRRGRRRRGGDESGAGVAAAAAAAKAACLYTTPSSSRKYAGPIFLFSALHCARTRSRRRFAAFEVLGGSEVVASRGSGKKSVVEGRQGVGDAHDAI